jgi:hypothetical protein
LALLLNEPLLPPLVPLVLACGNGWKKFVNIILTFSLYIIILNNQGLGGRLSGNQLKNRLALRPARFFQQLL